MALRVHCRSGHGTTHWHGAKEGIYHVGDSKIIELLTLIDGVAILASESFANGKMLKCAGNKWSDSSSGDF